MMERRNVEAELALDVVGSVPGVGMELGAVLVEAESVPECADNGVGGGKGETAVEKADGGDGIPEMGGLAEVF
jgi:hypothetical protein